MPDRRCRRIHRSNLGDLVFFGGSTADVSHVGIFVGNGQMVDAPHTGADARVEGVPTTVGAAWGGDTFCWYNSASQRMKLRSR
jgi:cell wall-associated NlpC family hydrolase